MNIARIARGTYAGAYADGTLARAGETQHSPGTVPRELGQKWLDGNEYTPFIMTCATSGEHVAVLWVKNSKIASEGADPATYTIV